MKTATEWARKLSIDCRFSDSELADIFGAIQRDALESAIAACEVREAGHVDGGNMDRADECASCIDAIRELKPEAEESES